MSDVACENVEPSHPAADGAALDAAPLRLIVIHGLGGTFAEAVATARELMSFACGWERGSFLVPRRTGIAVRRLLQVPDPGTIVHTFQKLVIARFPDRQLGRVTHATSGRFVRHPAYRLEPTGRAVSNVVDRSAPANRPVRGGHHMLVWTVVAALTVGVALVLLRPRFRPAAIDRSNAAFFPHIETPSDVDDGATTTGEAP